MLRALFCLSACLAARSAPSRLAAPHALLVESLSSPEGIDARSPRFSWLLGAAQPGARGLAQYAYELQLSFGATNFTTSQVLSNATSLVSPPGLPPLPPSSRVTWRVRAWEAAGADPSPLSAPASFTTGLAAWDGEWVCGARGTENAFRAAFALPQGGSPVALALAHVAGLGEHLVTLNGAPPPSGAQQQQRKLDGGWTSFKKRVLYTTHDLTGGLLAGENVLGVELGSSWFNARGWYAQPPYGWPSAANGGGFSYRAPPLLRVQLVLTLENGTVLRRATSGGGGGGGGGAAAWQWLAADSPTTFDSLYDGETRDGRRAAALAGWDAPGFAPAAAGFLPVASASNATLNPAAGAALAAQAYEPTVRLAAATPATMWEAAPGVTVYDCGSNGVGVVRWTFRGLPAGSNVTLRYAEVLQHPPFGPADGSLYFDNLRNAHATDYYFADGSGGEEVFEPLHTWHGFRYAQFEVGGGGGGAVAPPALTDVQCIRQGNAVAAGASAAFSLPELGAIQQLATNTMVGSFQHGPGSCGNRDERQFFTGDTQVTAQASMQYFRLRALMAAWLENGLTDQNADGSIGFYLPTPIGDARTGSPQWSTGFLTVAWLLLRLEGDFASVAAAYPAIQRYLAFNEQMYAQSVAKCGGLACYWPAWPSEWQQLGPSPNASCMNSMAYIRDAQMGADVAQWLGQAADAAAYSARARARLAEFHAAFYNASTGAFGRGTQSENAMALWLGAAAAPGDAAAAFAALLAAIEAAGFKQQTGIVGTRYLYEALAAGGRADVALRILQDTTFPSFGFMAGLGANSSNPEPSDTLWEIWAAHTGDPIMASRNHLMFASYSSALLMLAVGVTPRGPGAAQGALVAPAGLGAPRPPAGAAAAAAAQPLDFASGSMATPRGQVQVSWSRLPAQPPPAPPAAGTCGAAEEADEPGMAYVNISCGAPGRAIAGLAFVSFGRPSGACGGAPFAADPACNSPTAPALVAAACVGREACSIAVDFRALGDACAGKKWLAVNASGCSGPPPPPPPPPPPLRTAQINISMPVGLPAGVRLPASANATVTEGGAPVWAGGAFVPGVAGVVAGRAVAGGGGAAEVELEVLSGEYSFDVFEAA